MGSGIPNDLGKVAPVLPSVLRLVVHVDLGVVPHIGDDVGDLVDTSSDVLAVLAIANSPVK